MRSLVVLLVVAACGSSAEHREPSALPACVADGLGPLRNLPRLDTACTQPGRSCKRACDAGDADGCVQYGYDLQREKAGGAADAAFARACSLRLAIGCTNTGAYLWLDHQPAAAADVACARRLFDRSCDVREAFACGMKGRMLASDATTPEAREVARRFFDRTCTELGAMSCRMYALHLERGDLGDADPATIKALLRRACETGDDDACGDHATAGETFHD